MLHLVRKIGFYKFIRSICLFTIIIFGFMTIVGTGGGNWGLPELVNEGMYTSIAVDDLNGDGAIDIAVSYININGAPPHPSYISVILQDPLYHGNFFPSTVYAIGYDAWSVKIGDLNDDDLPDLVAANQNSNNFSILFQDTNVPGNFLAPISIQTGAYPSHVDICDLNLDGFKDLIVASNNTSFFLQNSKEPGTFHSGVALGFSSSCAAVDDLNNDGLPDIVFTHSDFYSVAVILQNPDNPGEFLSRSYYETGPQPFFVTIGKINEDELPDLAVVNIGSPDGSIYASVSVLFQNPDEIGSFFPSKNYITGRNSDEVLLEDLNRDNLIDLVVVNSNMINSSGWSLGSVSVMLQSEKNPNDFNPPMEYPMFYQPLSIAIGDLNGDSFPDVAVADDGAMVMFQNADNPGSFFHYHRVGG